MTDIVFGIIEECPGLAPREILQQPEAAAITAKSFPYLQLFKLKRAGEIEERDGRYFPAPERARVFEAGPGEL